MLLPTCLLMISLLGPGPGPGPTAAAASIGLRPLRVEAIDNSASLALRKEAGDRLKGPVIGGLAGGLLGFLYSRAAGGIGDTNNGRSTLVSVGIGVFAGAVIGLLIQGGKHQ